MKTNHRPKNKYRKLMLEVFLANYLIDVIGIPVFQTTKQKWLDEMKAYFKQKMTNKMLELFSFETQVIDVIMTNKRIGSIDSSDDGEQWKQQEVVGDPYIKIMIKYMNEQNVWEDYVYQQFFFISGLNYKDRFNNFLN